MPLALFLASRVKSSSVRSFSPHPPKPKNKSFPYRVKPLRRGIALWMTFHASAKGSPGYESQRRTTDSSELPHYGRSHESPPKDTRNPMRVGSIGAHRRRPQRQRVPVRSTGVGGLDRGTQHQRWARWVMSHELPSDITSPGSLEFPTSASGSVGCEYEKLFATIRDPLPSPARISHRNPLIRPSAGPHSAQFRIIGRSG